MEKDLKISHWKRYNVKIVFKMPKKDEKNVKNLQILVFLDEKLAFSSKKDVFLVKNYKFCRFKLNKWLIPVAETYKSPRLVWKDKDEQIRFLNMCKKLRFDKCIEVQERFQLESIDVAKKLA